VGSGLFFPPVEVVELDGTLTVRADLLGMTKEDVRVEITESILMIEGKRRAEHEEKQDGVVHSERRDGMFRRQITLPEGVNVGQATASFKDGVLEVTMPAPQWRARGRQIEIRSGASSPTASQAASGTEQEHAQSTTAVGRFLGLRVHMALPAADLPR
jgi:HSP20 family protein